MHTRSAPLLLALLLAGCGSTADNPVMRKARETDAFANLRRWSTSQSMIFAEEGRFGATLEELDRARGMLKPGMAQASTHASNPKALNGYFYTQLV